MPDLILPDSRIEDTALFYPGRKPVKNVSVDKTFKNAPGVFMLAKDLAIQDAASGRRMSLVGSAEATGSSIKLTDSGDNYYAVEGGRINDFYASTSQITARPMTWIVDVIPNEATGSSRCFSCCKTSDVDLGLSLLLTIVDLKIDFLLYNLSNNAGERIRATSTSAELTLNQRHIICVTYDGGISHTGLNLYVDGRLVSSTRTTELAFASPNYQEDHRLYIGASLPVSDSYKDFSNIQLFSLQAITGKELPASEVQDISHNPYQSLIPT